MVFYLYKFLTKALTELNVIEFEDEQSMLDALDLNETVRKNVIFLIIRYFILEKRNKLPFFLIFANIYIYIYIYIFLF